MEFNFTFNFPAAFTKSNLIDIISPYYLKIDDSLSCEEQMYEERTYTDASEWRNSPRIDYIEPVDLVFNGRLYKGVSSNTSETGIFVKSIPIKDFNVFDELTISFKGPDLKPVKRDCRVARKTPDGIGILYLEEQSSFQGFQGYRSVG